jgi:hypothetical protein
MEPGEIIGSIIVLSIIGGVALIYFRTKDRKGHLTIMIDGDVVRLLLNDDEYDELNISNIKDDKEKVYQEIKKLIQQRSKELVKYIDRVTFFKDGDPKQEEELLNIIKKEEEKKNERNHTSRRVWYKTLSNYKRGI